MNTWLTADTHFWHRKIIDYCSRPFSSVTEMNEALISNWNEVVKPTDTVYHLGDVAFCNQDELRIILHQLHGEKHLIRGNHDLKRIKGSSRSHFETIRDYHELRHEGNKIVLSHYPMLSWNGSHHGSLHCHGHSHGNSPAGKNRTDVGVDTNNFYPYNLEDLTT